MRGIKAAKYESVCSVFGLQRNLLPSTLFVESTNASRSSLLATSVYYLSFLSRAEWKEISNLFQINPTPGIGPCPRHSRSKMRQNREDGSKQAGKSINRLGYCLVLRLSLFHPSLPVPETTGFLVGGYSRGNRRISVLCQSLKSNFWCQNDLTSPGNCEMPRM